MIRGAITLCIVVTAGAIILVIAGPALTPHSPAYYAQMEALELQKEQSWANFWSAVPWMAAGAAGFTMFGGYRWLMKGRAIQARQLDLDSRRAHDGQHALIRERQRYIDEDGKEIETDVLVDPSQMIAASRWDPKRGAYVAAFSGIPQEWQYQLALARSNGVNLAQAIYPGNAAYIDGDVRAVPRVPGMAGLGRNASRVEIVEPQQNYLPEFETLTPADVLADPNRDRWIMGQSATGQLAHFSASEDTNLLIVGSPGTGKTTNSLMQATMKAAQSGHAIILDGKGGADLRGFQGHTEWLPSDGETLGAQILVIGKEFKRRAAILNERGAPDIEELRKLGISWPHIFVVWEEAGLVLEDVRSKNGENTKYTLEVLKRISSMMRSARFTGIHFVLADQNPSKLKGSTLTAMGRKVLSYHLDISEAGIIADQKVMNLPRGHFRWQGQEYNAFYMAPLLPAWLKQHKPGPWQPIMTPAALDAAHRYLRELAEKPKTAAAPRRPEPEPEPAPAPPAPITIDGEATPVETPAATPAEQPGIAEEFVEIGRKNSSQATQRYAPAVENWILENAEDRLFSRVEKDANGQITKYGARDENGSPTGYGASEVARLLADVAATQFGEERREFGAFKSLAQKLLIEARTAMLGSLYAVPREGKSVPKNERSDRQIRL